MDQKVNDFYSKIKNIKYKYKQKVDEMETEIITNKAIIGSKNSQIEKLNN